MSQGAFHGVARQVSNRTPLLEIKHLSVDYHAGNGTVHGLTDVSVTLERGQILGLAGESGSGKSTLGYAVTRLLKPPAEIIGGEVLYYPRANERHPNSGSPIAGPPATLGYGGQEGRAVDLLKLSTGQLRAIRWKELAIVFQSAMNALNPVITVGAQIMDVLRAHRPEMTRAQRIARATELLRLVSIAPDRLRSYPHELSGGMRQRAIIAIALALGPEVIIMDEPTTALDVVVQREILMEIVALRTDLEFSVIFITHDLSLLLELADKVAIMYAGRVVEMATRDELKAQPRHPYSYGMLNSFPTIHGERRRMTGIPGAPPDLRNIPPGCAFHPRCPMVVAACRSELPALRGAMGSADSQQVACHLYDPRHGPSALPTVQTFAAGYESAYARGQVAGQGERSAP
ncbi:MAG TPA: ABC transporter ATP-binding protein [Ktedonobacterales bacterium]|jgi:peptide/nickel transport system ATP-binding protein|nr:ABC transporter ATP-binding protein [Ktedonobacterales bacterium]